MGTLLDKCDAKVLHFLLKGTKDGYMLWASIRG